MSDHMLSFLEGFEDTNGIMG